MKTYGESSFALAGLQSSYIFAEQVVMELLLANMELDTNCLCQSVPIISICVSIQIILFLLLIMIMKIPPPDQAQQEITI